MKLLNKIAISTGALFIGSTAFAAGPDFSQLGSVDFSSATQAVISIAAAIAGVKLAVAGSRAVLRMFGAA